MHLPRSRRGHRSRAYLISFDIYLHIASSRTCNRGGSSEVKLERERRGTKAACGTVPRAVGLHKHSIVSEYNPVINFPSVFFFFLSSQTSSKKNTPDLLEIVWYVLYVLEAGLAGRLHVE